MAEFTIKSFPQILMDMVSTFTANSDVTDLNAGSVALTMLEAAATEDANTYIQMLNIIRSYSLDTTVGTDLDDRAYEYGLVRYDARAASGYVTFYDISFEKVQTEIYTGLAAPQAGHTVVYGFSMTGFSPAGGSIIIGRNTNNVETVPYGSITDMGGYYRFNLTAPLTKDHGLEESIIFSQGGNRVIPAGTGVYVPESDITPQIDFVLQGDSILLDGENVLSEQLVICTEVGSIGNIKTGAIRYFSSAPFPTAVVTNPLSFTTGRDIETDADLRERIRDTIQSLSRGTMHSILTLINEVTSEYQNNRVVSSAFTEATTLNHLNFLYIDDGQGLEPWFESIDYEVLVEQALGAEKFLQINTGQTPIMRAAIETAREEPFGVSGGNELIVEVNYVQETIVFDGAKILTDGAATAEEIVRCINDESVLVEARTSQNRTKVIIEPKEWVNETIQIIGGNANTGLGFREGVRFYTLSLYKNDQLLNKDGESAYVINAGQEPIVGGYVGLPGTTLRIIVDNKIATIQDVNFTAETSAEHVANTINAQIAGATARVLQREPVVPTETGRRVIIFSNNPDPAESSIQIYATGSTANAILGYPTDVQWGKSKDYVLNRYNGQIELTDPLVAGDEVIIGSPYTRPYIESSVPSALPNGAFTVFGGEELIFQVDDFVLSTVTAAIDASNFIDGALPAVYPRDGHFNGKWVRFTDTTLTAALQGVSRLITSYDATTGQIGTAAFPAAPQFGDEYEIVQIITIPGAVSVSYTAAEAQSILASQVVGVHFYEKQRSLNKYIRFASNSYSLSSRLRVHPATTTAGFFFPADQTASAQDSNVGFIESGNEGPFTFGVNQNLILIADNDPTYKTIPITMNFSGVVTAAVSTSAFRASGLLLAHTTADILNDMVVRFRDTTPTPDIQSEIRTIIGYNQTNGQVTVNAPFSAAPQPNDLFDIIPRTVANVVYLFRNPAFTNLSKYCEINETDNGNRVQIHSLVQGGAGGIQCAGGSANRFSIYLTAGTSGDALGHIFVDTLDGLSIGLECEMNDNGFAGPADVTITDITGAVAPYDVTLSVDSGGTDVSMYTSTQGAYLRERNQFNFSTVASLGRDGYRYYTGLIQEAQWQLDGKNTDITNYPGVKAAGAMIEVRSPVIEYIPNITIDITPAEGVSMTDIRNSVKGAVSNYINTLGVGQNVILAKIVAACMAIGGVRDARILVPTSNVIIAPNEKAKILEPDIICG